MTTDTAGGCLDRWPGPGDPKTVTRGSRRETVGEERI
jgi:hypothetical protein